MWNWLGHGYLDYTNSFLRQSRFFHSCVRPLSPVPSALPTHIAPQIEDAAPAGPPSGKGFLWPALNSGCPSPDSSFSSSVSLPFAKHSPQLRLSPNSSHSAL